MSISVMNCRKYPKNHNTDFDNFIQAVLAELKGLDPDFRLIKRESVMLQEILRESPTLARQTNFFDEIERLDRDWRKAVSDLDEIYMKLLSEVKRLKWMKFTMKCDKWSCFTALWQTLWHFSK